MTADSLRKDAEAMNTTDAHLIEHRPWARILEHVPQTPVGRSGSRRAGPYVSIIGALALALATVVWRETALASQSQLLAVGLMAAIGVAAELLLYQHKRGTSGSISL